MTIISTNSQLKSFDGHPSSEILSFGWRSWEDLRPVDGVYFLVDGFAVADNGSSNGSGQCDKADERNHLVQLYKKEGADFIKRLRGSFVLALWDSKRKQLILATDHLGTRPLYYWCGKDQIAFAPRVNHFLASPNISKTIDPNSLYFYINHSFIPAPYTIYKDIKRLEPGQYLLWENERYSIHQYWDMSYPENSRLKEHEAAELVRSAVEKSLRFRIGNEKLSVEKLGAFLSGGTDSSTVVGLLSRITGKRIKSFSVGFDETPYNEIHYARVAASHFDSDIHEYFVRPNEALKVLPTLAEAYDEPFGNSSAIPTYFCLKMAREAGVKVMFAGDGGDELFAGNERYLSEMFFAIYHIVPRWMRRWIDMSAEILPSTFPLRKVKNYIHKANLSPVDRFFFYQVYFRDRAGQFLTDDFRNAFDEDFPLKIPRRHYERAGDVNALNRLLYTDLKLAIADNDLFKVNRMAESHGLQVYYPFLDKQVAGVSGTIPARFKLKNWNKRYIFKKAFENLLPLEVLHKKKHGFGLPTGEWLRHDSCFRDLARSLLLDPRSIQRGYFKREALESLLHMHDRERTNYYGTHIWNFMMLELWHRTHADKKSIAF